MKTVCYYVADDGTKFDEERDCFNYEFEQKMKGIVGKDLRLFDEKHKEITKYTYDSVYDAFAIQVLTVEGAKFFAMWADDYGTTTPFDAQDVDTQDEDLLGIWVYEAIGLVGWTHLDKFKREVDELYFALQ